ncbi:hypothetical protein QBC39DRAFT_170782 [Podospora conica]|nr:hypothetical protein QBC39DRAFT_170782 [Schizothecium conicum]
MPPRQKSYYGSGDTVNLKEIAGLLGSSSATTRKEALESLLSYFKATGNGSQSTQKQGFEDKTYHSLFEALFRCILMEKETFFNTKKASKTSVAASTTRLEKCAEALRLAVRHGANRIKRKTGRAIVDHIIQTLPGPDGNYIAPLLNDYVKTLGIFLDVPANVENLATKSGEGWDLCTTFCFHGLLQYLNSIDPDNAGWITAPTASGSNLRASNSRAKSVLPLQPSAQITSQLALEFLQCLNCLVSSANAPVMRQADVLARAVLRMLGVRGGKIGELQKTAFSTITNIFLHIQTDNILLGKAISTHVIPHLSHWWQPRTLSRDAMLNSTRDEMIKAMYSTHLYQEALLRDSPSGAFLKPIEDLLDALWSEYSKREERARLQLDDLSFSAMRFPVDHPTTPAFKLRPFNSTAEQNWALLENMAIMEALCARYPKRMEFHGDGDSDGDRPRKKRQVNSAANRLHEKMTSLDPAIQLTALQLVPFLVRHREFSLDQLTELVKDVRKCMPTKQSVAASWGMLACASISTLELAKDASLAPFWKLAWQHGVQSLILPSISRASCVLLESILQADLVVKHELTDDVTLIITTADISGPALLVDSSLVLMASLLRLRNVLFPNASQKTANHVARWVFMKWNPVELQQVSTHAVLVTPFDLVSLLRACLGMIPLFMTAPLRSFGGSLGQYWKFRKHAHGAIRYLLHTPHEEDENPSSDILGYERPTDPHQDSDASETHAVRRLILELLSPKIQEIARLTGAWPKRGGENAAPPTPERFQSTFLALVTGLLVVPELAVIKAPMMTELQEALNTIIESTVILANATQNWKFMDSILILCTPFIPPTFNNELLFFRNKYPQFLKLYARISRELDSRDERESTGRSPDDMDIDDEFESQASQGHTTSKIRPLPRRDIALCHTPEAFYMETAHRIHHLQIIFEDEGACGTLPEEVPERLVKLTNEQFLYCQAFIREMFTSYTAYVSDVPDWTAQKVGEIIGDENLRCCEAALCACIDILTAMVDDWGYPDEKPMFADIYQYLVETSLPNGCMSIASQVSLTTLLLKLEERKPLYASKIPLPSSRSTLFTVLRDGPMEIKFSIGLLLPKLFGLFVLKTHDEIFVDVLEKLPADPAHVEGIAFRMFVLSVLACQWPTLLRRCVYHIFETPGKIPGSAPHARMCLQRVSDALRLTSPQELFTLFAPQLLYTWLEGDSINCIPFNIFGFQNLEELLSTAQTEAAAIMLMRGQQTEVAELARLLGDDLAALITRGFTKIMAYCIAHDISVPSSSAHITGENRIRTILGKETFLGQIHLNFAEIIATFFDIFDQEDPIESAFAKDDRFTSAANIMGEIKKYGFLPTALPPNQQPMFKAKYLQREIVHLCSRTSYELGGLWTPALVTFVARKLLNTVHPALGPLHACSVLRKIRVLICLAGDQALASYPLEMLLTSSRPFVLDPECADDALGVAQYLLVKGKGHLAKAPSFFAGYALSSLADLRVFMESSQASTTQESQFRASKDKARNFHGWFRKHLTQYTSPLFKDYDQQRAFQAITSAAAAMDEGGNAVKGRQPGTLLLEIIKDWGRENQLLNEPARNAALTMLYGDFYGPPPTASNDIIDTDEAAIDHSAVVWRSCGALKQTKSYLAWAGRVLGRSFAASGEVPQELLRESRLEEYRRLSPGKSGSEEAIVSLVYALTVSNDCTTAGLAESAIRATVTEATVDENPDLLFACSTSLPESLFYSSSWEPYQTPSSDVGIVLSPTESEVFDVAQLEDPKWAQNLTTYLAYSVPNVVVMKVLPPLLSRVKEFAEKAFALIVHLALSYQLGDRETTKTQFSEALKEWLSHAADTPVAKENMKLLLNTILYLRTQRLPKETSIADRAHWVEFNHWHAARAATRCGMHKVALLFAEIAGSEATRASRRSSMVKDVSDSDEIILSIFENIDDPDAYYGLDEEASLSSVLARLEYENDGGKSLAFRGAVYDDHLRSRDASSAHDAQALISSLSTLGLAGLSNSLLQAQQSLDGSSSSLYGSFTTARRLEMWDLPAPSDTGNWAVTVYKAFQSMHQAAEINSVRAAIYEGLGDTVRHMTSRSLNTSGLRHQLAALAALTELDDLVNVSNSQDLKNVFAGFERRTKWMMSGRYGDVSQVLSCRETSLSMWEKGYAFRPATLESNEARLYQIRGMLLSSGIYRFHRAFQETLNLSTRLTGLIQPSKSMGMGVDAGIRMEAANSLWDQGEMVASIRMLQRIDKDPSFKKQMLDVSRSDLLSKIGYQVSVARLESPDNIQKKYLEPALKELKGKVEGNEAGKVYHQFAMFCDEQLQNPDNLEDLARLKHLKQGKSDEVSQLKALMASSRDSQQKHKYSSHLAKAKQWLELDQQELRRAEQSRAEFVRLSLENYLLSLQASDEHNNDALRFTALWLERSEEDATNDAVKKHIGKVPTHKFAPLMNQLSSRLQDYNAAFQKLLIDLVFRICIDHPYHGMYQIWSGAKSRVNKEDEIATSRQRATERVAKALSKSEQVSKIWTGIDATSRVYHALALDRDARYKAGQKIAIKDTGAGNSFLSTVAKYAIPPPTMQLELSAARDYSDVPMIAKFEPDMSIASGVSAPKIITAVGTDGRRYKQLVKGGNDDLRQDAIMEQVFAAVSELLKLHRTTRQRNLGIRTYKVLPLTSSSGLIEFVSDTIPLHEYLMPAHERYYPKDYKGSQCRKEITNAQTKSIDNRVSVYRKVTDRFHPVMRYFFMENFADPDEWFRRRTAYTRTTAAISMLGHVLGLGDRHGHNILLDTKTGEVVHIDLGVAFEMGRVLPVPELVPFRLTRDIVDGMGISKTEGVFRRCCEFTLDALREEMYSIMTILDVLRYDPLYSWSISPVRMAKLQNAARGEGGGGEDDDAEVEGKRSVNEPSEADRALEVVRKKLSKTLSVNATVNDLINQATDERNLAVLYSGWAAYA